MHKCLWACLALYNIFISVCHFVHRACVCQGCMHVQVGVHAKGVCMPEGACIPREEACLRVYMVGAWVLRDMHGGGMHVQGTCVVGGHE